MPDHKSSKLCLSGGINTTDSCSATNKVQGVKLRCYMPEKDVKCYVTKNTEIDGFTKHIVRYQVSKKIYTTPKVNTRMAPQKKAEKAEKEKTEEDKQKKEADVENTDSTRYSNPGLKCNKIVFKKNIDNIDVDLLLSPIRASTPTPSHHDSTILAGHWTTHWIMKNRMLI